MCSDLTGTAPLSGASINFRPAVGRTGSAGALSVPKDPDGAARDKVPLSRSTPSQAIRFELVGAPTDPTIV